MACARIDDAQRIAQGVQVNRNGAHLRVGRVGKVDGDSAADRGSGLIHQAAGFSKIEVLRLLAHLRNGHRAELVVAEQVIFNHAQQHLTGCRGGQARARQHIRHRVDIITRHRVAPLHRLLGHAAHQRRGALLLVLSWTLAVQLHFHHRPAFRLEANGVGAVGSRTGQEVHIHRRSQHAAVLMVGVVAANFRAARGGAQGHRCILSPAKAPLKSIQKRRHPPTGCGRVCAAGQAGQRLIHLSCVQRLAHIAQFMHLICSPFVCRTCRSRPVILSQSHAHFPVSRGKPPQSRPVLVSALQRLSA